MSEFRPPGWQFEIVTLSHGVVVPWSGCDIESPNCVPPSPLHTVLPGVHEMVAAPSREPPMGVGGSGTPPSQNWGPSDPCSLGLDVPAVPTCLLHALCSLPFFLAFHSLSLLMPLRLYIFFDSRCLQQLFLLFWLFLLDSSFSITLSCCHW